jgi:hypothetical protein
MRGGRLVPNRKGRPWNRPVNCFATVWRYYRSHSEMYFLKWRHLCGWECGGREAASGGGYCTQIATLALTDQIVRKENCSWDESMALFTNRSWSTLRFDLKIVLRGLMWPTQGKLRRKVRRSNEILSKIYHWKYLNLQKKILREQYFIKL